MFLIYTQMKIIITKFSYKILLYLC